MLEEVGEPRPARLLVLGPCVEPLVHVDDGERPVDVQDDLRAVRERVARPRDGRPLQNSLSFFIRASPAFVSAESSLKSAASGARKLKHAFPCIRALSSSEIPSRRSGNM